MLGKEQTSTFQVSPCVEIISVPPPEKQKPKRVHSSFKAKYRKTPNKYFLFCKKRRTELHALHPEITSREVTKILASEWKAMSYEEQESYASMYVQMVEKNQSNEDEMKEKTIPLWIDIPTATGELMRVAAYYRKE